MYYTKGIVPQALENKPDIEAYLLEYLEAFYYLSCRRTVGFSAENPIAMSEIRSYMETFNTEDREMMTYLIGEMDSEYLSIRYREKPKVVNTENAETMTGNKF